MTSLVCPHKYPPNPYKNPSQLPQIYPTDFQKYIDKYNKQSFLAKPLNTPDKLYIRLKFKIITYYLDYLGSTFNGNSKVLDRLFQVLSSLVLISLKLWKSNLVGGFVRGSPSYSYEGLSDLKL